jgi:nucleoside-diphosphate-sugar epimerase
VVEQALAAGHEVVAYVRNPAKLRLEDLSLTVLVGELADAPSVGTAVRGSDAVISAVGPSLSREAQGMPLVAGTNTILAAMQGEGVERLVGIATPSLRDPRDTPSLLGRVVPVMGRLMFPRAYRELLAMCELITSSDRDWTIARFTRPTNKPATGSIRAGFLGRDRIAGAITRADIAAFLLAQATTDDRFHHAAPAISN